MRTEIEIRKRREGRMMPCRELALIAMLVIGQLAAASVSGPAEAKRVTPANCEWFGTAPLCDGECPNGWTQTRRSGRGCATGSKAYCCNFQEVCVPDRPAPGWDPNGRRTVATSQNGVSGTLTKCQRCVKWADDCQGGNRFQTKCAAFTWVDCGFTPSSQSGQPPKCPPGLMGPNCDVVIVR